MSALARLEAISEATYRRQDGEITSRIPPQHPDVFFGGAGNLVAKIIT
jgi:hypothetical protein